MIIRNKIVFSTMGMVFLAVLLSVSSAIWLLGRGIETQTGELLKELEVQSLQRITSGRKILANAIDYHIRSVSSATANACLDIPMRETLGNGQWKSLFARATRLSETAEIDFMVVFDIHGTVVATYPAKMDEEYPERHFTELGLFRSFETAITQWDLTETGVVSCFDVWDRELLRGYNIDTDRKKELIVLSAGILPNDFMDAPVGYILTGITGPRLSLPYAKVTDATGQFYMMMHEQTPLVWTGKFGSSKGKDSRPPVLELTDESTGGTGKICRASVSGKEFHCISSPFPDFLSLGEAGQPRNMTRAAASCRIIVGEPADLIENAGMKIVKEGDVIKKRILSAALAISVLVMVLTLFLMSMIGKRIAGPVALAAQMSDKIASGDLSPVLNAPGTDETAVLAKSMNRMVQRLKTLNRKNQAHVQALEESEGRFRKLFDNSHGAIALVENHTGKIIDANARLFEISQCTRDDILGKTVEELGFYQTEDQTPLMDRLRRDGEVKDWEVSFPDKGGSTSSILLFAVPIRIRDDNFFLVEFYDITERKRLESQLKQSLKMESIGTLTGGIAHDFNNILGVILGNTEMAMADSDETHPVYEYLATVKSASLKAAEIISQLLNYSRRSRQNLSTIDIIPVIHETVNFLRSSIPATVRIEKEIEGDTLFAMADPIQINQVIMNLSINAYQAMKDAKGTIRIHARITEVNLETAGKRLELTPGKYARLDISDDGSGIRPDILNRIFDPYFTTKEVGKGSGMGLSVVHGIIKTHKGAIRVDSTPGKGAQFSVFLPLAETAPSKDTTREPGAPAQGTGTVLLVEDDRVAAGMYAKMLTRMGYRVEAYTKPPKALKRFASSPRTFDLVFTDMTMPEMTGADLTEAVKAVRKDIPVIICTGHSDLMDEQKAKDIGISAYVMKPIVFSKLSHTVRNVLDASEKAFGNQ